MSDSAVGEQVACSPGNEVRRRLWRTPVNNRASLCDPSLDTWSTAADVTRRQLLRLPEHAEYTRRARAEIRQAAYRYTQTYRDISPPPTVDGPLVMAGHQPELFHPGVWLKNAALSQWLHKAGSTATAINLVIDSDLIKSATLRVPVRDGQHHAWSEVPLDGGPAQVPWEMRSVLDHELLSSIAQRFPGHALVPADSLWTDFQQRLCERARETGNLGLAIAQARHQIEASWGWTTYELPLSAVLQLPVVQEFLFRLLTDLPRYRISYNESLLTYRQTHGLTGDAHPAPLLAARDTRLEAPLWCYSSQRPRRSRVWWRCVKDGFELTTDTDTLGEWRQAQALHWLSDLQEGAGFRLRPKALLTTLIARTLLGDFFVHGIGGAKYDQAVDQTINSLWGYVPGYAVVSGTLFLPGVSAPPAGLAADLQQTERGLRYHAEQALQSDPNPAVGELIERKARLLCEPSSAARHRALTECNRSLAEWVADRRSEVLEQLRLARIAVRSERVFPAREVAFALHGSDELRKFLSTGFLA